MVLVQKSAQVKRAEAAFDWSVIMNHHERAFSEVIESA
jgi:hypothetical protein